MSAILESVSDELGPFERGFLYCNIKAFIISCDGGAFLENNRTLCPFYVKETPLRRFGARTGITEKRQPCFG